MNALYVYKSSAGSGKTFTLVKEYLKIVLQNPSAYRHTLAITFTNKATAEMKERIVSGLVELAEDRPTKLKAVLEEEINNPKINLQERAQIVLKSILHDYSNFSISTIDSFFSRIIRSLAKEMQLPLKFEMEMNQDYITTKLTEMLISDVGKSPILTEWLQQFVFEKMENEKGWNIEREIKTVANEIFKNRHRDDSEEKRISLPFIDLLKKIKFSFEKQMQLFGKEFISAIESQSLTIEDFAYGKSGVANYFFKIYDGLSGMNWIPGSRVIQASESSENWVSKKSTKRNQIITLAESQFIPLLNKILAFHNHNFKNYISACEVLNVAYMAGIVNYLQSKMSEYRDENDVLLMSDTNKLLKEFISDYDTPFIYEKTGNKYQNYLIDEFQDTADLQWDNLLPLIINGLGTGGLTMLVGDAKQSIYRWRGGNSKLLLENINKDLHFYSSIKDTFHLDTNYRSYKEIVGFNNTFFSMAPPLLRLSDPGLMKLAYFEKDTVQKNITSKSQGGYVSVTLFPKMDKNEDGLAVDWKDSALAQMTVTIRQLLQQGYDLNDIAILVRKNEHGRMVADHLFSNGFKKISSADSLLLHTAPQIIFLTNILTVLAWPDNKPALAEITYYYQKVILTNETIENHQIFFAAGEKTESKSNTFLPETWYNQKDNLATLPIYELVEKLINLFSLNAIPDAYVQRFQDMILNYSSKNQPAIKDFLTWWAEHKENDKLAVVTPQDKDAINQVSIHKSKGLQYPVIIMPFTEWSLVPKPNELLWISSEHEPYNQLDIFPVKTNKILAETYFAESFQEETDQTYLDNLNLLYVAFTRAEEKLYLFSVNDDAEEKDITRVSQLMTSLLKQEPSWQNKLSKNGETITYEFGENSFKSGAKQPETIHESSFEKPENISLTSYPFGQWQENISVRVSRGFSGGEEDDEKLAAIDSGLLLHEMMSLITYKSDKEKALQKIKSEHLLSTDETKQLEVELDLIFSLTDHENWFGNDWHILNEAEIADPEGNLIRPDRVMIKDQTAIVLDYKTGLSEKKHLEQVDAYSTALERMGYHDVKSYLLYLQEKKLVKVK